MRCLTESDVSAVTATAVRVPFELQDVLANTIQDVDAEDFNVLRDDVTLVSSEYPPENVLDEHPKRVCKVAWPQATFDVTVSGSGSTVVIGATNARTALFTIYDSEDNEVHSELMDLGGIDTYTRLILDRGIPLNYTGVDYPYQMVAHRIVIELSTGSVEHLYVGLIQAGVLYQSGRDVDKGLNEGLLDYSIEKEMSNGSFYYKQRDIVRTFSGKLLLDRESDFYEFMHTIFRAKGKKPLFWQITDIDSPRWFVYARATRLPSASHLYYDKSSISFQLIEVL